MYQTNMCIVYIFIHIYVKKERIFSVYVYTESNELDFFFIKCTKHTCTICDTYHVHNFYYTKN